MKQIGLNTITPAYDLTSAGWLALYSLVPLTKNDLCCVQLKDLLELRKAELTASYEHLLKHISATRKQVCFAVVVKGLMANALWSLVM